MAPFRINTTGHADRCVLALVGEADLDAQPQILELGSAALADHSTPTLVLDLAGVTFIDSTGLSALVHLRNEAQTLGKQLQLSGVPDRVRQILDLTGLSTVFQEVPQAASQTAAG
jgi:anti-sigma B factor antagonist